MISEKDIENYRKYEKQSRINSRTSIIFILKDM